MPSEIEARGRSLEKTDGYVLKKANVIIERRRMIMKVLVSALFAVAVIISPALADEREDAYAGVERWSAAFNSRDVEQIVRMYTSSANGSYSTRYRASRNLAFAACRRTVLGLDILFGAALGAEASDVPFAFLSRTSVFGPCRECRSGLG
jgi:hypothetical protein